MSKENLDSSSLISAAEASKKFKRAEKRSGEFMALSLNVFVIKVDGHRAT